MKTPHRSPMKRFVLLAAAAATASAALVPAPALAGGKHGYYDSYGYGGRYDRGYYGRHRYYDYRHKRRGHISGGEAALIAAGIIGGVILIDRALDDRDRRYEDRYDRRYDDRYDRPYDDRYRRRYSDGYYYQRDDRDYDYGPSSGRTYDRGFEDGYSAARGDGDVDDRLLGDDDRGAGAPAGRPVFADAAFRECVAETRGAAGQGGLRVAMPSEPDRIEDLADGSVRMSASFRTSNGRGDQRTRRFVCEADDQGVRFLQVD
jgi:hypothetical protein